MIQCRDNIKTIIKTPLSKMSTAVLAGSIMLVHRHAQSQAHENTPAPSSSSVLFLLFLFGVLWPLTNNLLVTLRHLLDWSVERTTTSRQITNPNIQTLCLPTSPAILESGLQT